MSWATSPTKSVCTSLVSEFSEEIEDHEVRHQIKTSAAVRLDEEEVDFSFMKQRMNEKANEEYGGFFDFTDPHLGPQIISNQKKWKAEIVEEFRKNNPSNLRKIFNKYLAKEEELNQLAEELKAEMAAGPSAEPAADESAEESSEMEAANSAATAADEAGEEATELVPAL